MRPATTNSTNKAPNVTFNTSPFQTVFAMSPDDAGRVRPANKSTQHHSLHTANAKHRVRVSGNWTKTDEQACSRGKKASKLNNFLSTQSSLLKQFQSTPNTPAKFNILAQKINFLNTRAMLNSRNPSSLDRNDHIESERPEENQQTLMRNLEKMSDAVYSMDGELGFRKNDSVGRSKTGKGLRNTRSRQRSRNSADFMASIQNMGLEELMSGIDQDAGDNLDHQELIENILCMLQKQGLLNKRDRSSQASQLSRSICDFSLAGICDQIRQKGIRNKFKAMAENKQPMDQKYTKIRRQEEKNRKLANEVRDLEKIAHKKFGIDFKRVRKAAVTRMASDQLGKKYQKYCYGDFSSSEATPLETVEASNVSSANKIMKRTPSLCKNSHFNEIAASKALETQINQQYLIKRHNRLVQFHIAGKENKSQFQLDHEKSTQQIPISRKSLSQEQEREEEELEIKNLNVIEQIYFYKDNHLKMKQELKMVKNEEDETHVPKKLLKNKENAINSQILAGKMKSELKKKNNKSLYIRI